MKVISRAFIRKVTTLKSGATALLAALVLPMGAQTFNGQGGLLIPPGAPMQTVGITQSPCTVSGVGVLGGCLQIASVTMNINHTFDGDVGILLVAPNGAFLDLTTSNGGAGDNWTNCTFSDAAGAFITTGAPPYTGTWRPEGRATTLNQPYSNANPLGTFTFANTFTGVNADGDWILYVNDYVAADVGIINSWSITFTSSGTPPPAFPASMSACAGANGQASFNLTTLNETVNGGTGLPVSYYLNNNATGLIANAANFTTATSTTVYAVVMGGCPSDPVPITLTVLPAQPLPGASVTITPPDNCGSTPGTIVFNLGAPGAANITYSLVGPSINQTFSATTNAAGIFTLPFTFNANLTATLLTASQVGGCAYTFPPVSDQFVLLPGPTINVTSPNIFCQGVTIDLNTLVSSTGIVTFHSSNPPTAFNQLGSSIVTLQNTITYYALAQTAAGCSSTAAVPITVQPAATPNLSPATVCQTGGLFSLNTIQDPAFPGGTWSGPGVVGNTFNPGSLNGNYTLTFTPSAACALPATTTITVVPPNFPQLGTATICATSGPFNLATLRDPAFLTGTWSGPGVSGGFFNPAGFSGPVTLTFTSNQSCTPPVTTQVTVQPAQQPVLGTTTLCNTNPPLSLATLADPNFPSGGNWSGPGVSGGFFNPANLSGPITLVFTPTGMGCFAGASTTVQVTAPATPNLNSTNLCEVQGPYNLNQLLGPGSPAGIWSGPGVTGNNFNPLGHPGVNTLTFTPSTPCSVPGTTTINVAALATPVLGTTTLCSNAAPLNLTTLQQPGFGAGVWSGSGVTGNQFNPTGLSGPITLTFTPSASCTAPATTTVTVTANQAPVLGTATLCANSGLFDLSVLLPSGTGVGVWSGPGVTSNQLNPSGLSGAVALTFTPAGSCVLPASTSVTVNASAAPSFNTQFSGTLCPDDCLQAAPTLTGQGPFSLIFEIEGPQGSATDTLQIASSGATITICPDEYALGTGAYTLTALQIADANCQQPLDLPLGAFQTVNPVDTLASTLCPGETVTVGNQTFNEANPSGSVVLTAASVNGCDSLVQVSLSFFAASTGQFSQTLCPGETVTIGSQTFDAATPSGTVILPNAAATGCDSTVQVSLSFFPASTGQVSQTLCQGQSLTVGSQTFDATNPTGTVLFANAAVNGCDSTVTVSLTFYNPVATTLSTTLCPGQSLTVGTQTFDSTNPTGTVLFANAAVNGCDSTVTVSLTFYNPVVTNLNQTLCDGEALTVGSQTFDVDNPAGTVLFANGTTNGCDSTVQVSLSFFPASTGQLNPTLCDGETLTVGTQTFDASNPAGTVLLANAATTGCDSTVQVSVSFFPQSIGQLTQTLCSGETLTVGNQTFNAANPTGNVLLANAAATGCDSTVQVSLSFFPQSIGQLTQTLCNGESLTVGNQTFNAANPTGSVLFANAAASGCDSTVQVSVSFFPQSIGQLTPTLCDGEALTVGNQTFNAANPTGSVLFANAAATGCDSTVQVSVSFFPVSASQLNQTLCNGESLTVGNQTFNAANPTGSVLFANAAASGCDSTVQVSVSFFPQSIGQLTPTLCDGESLTIGSQIFDATNPTGNVLFANAAATGCDSTVQVSVSFYPVSTGQLSPTLCNGESLTVGNQTFNAANPTGTVLFANAAATGCDSTVQVSVSFFPVSAGQLNPTLCNGETLTVGNQTFNAANPTGSVVLANAAASGCDSTVTVSLSFFPVSTGQLNPTLCNGETLTVGNQTFNAANPTGSVLFANAAATGCDSTVQVSLSFFPVSTGQLTQNLCNGETLTVGNQTFGASNPSGSVVLANAAATGCDSTVQVSVSFFPVSTGQLSQSLCAGQSLTVGNQTFNAANPTGTVLFANAAATGCDSTVTVSLTFQEVFAESLSVTICEGESYTFDGQSLTTAGVYAGEFTTVSGCDSLVTLTLAISQPPQIVMDSMFQIVPRQFVTLQPDVSGSVSCNWFPASLVLCSTCCDTRTVSITQDTVLTLYAVDENGCESSFEVSILARERPTFYVPNVFRPGSPANGYFTLYGTDAIEEIEEMMVFTRWGESVFERTHFQPDLPQLGWDGTFRGQVLDTGVFVWYARLKLRNGRVIVEKGDVTLLR